MMLQLSPSKRPSCNALLENSIILDHMSAFNDLDSSVIKENNKKPMIRCKSSLLRTIKLPKDLKVFFNFFIHLTFPKDINCSSSITKVQGSQQKSKCLTSTS